MPATMEVQNNPYCLICYGRVGVSIRNTVNIFDSRTYSNRDFPAFISEVLQVQIKEDTVHSLLMCKKCFKLFDELDELEKREIDIKEELLASYEESLRKHEKLDVMLEEIKDQNIEEELEEEEFDIQQLEEDSELHGTVEHLESNDSEIAETPKADSVITSDNFDGDHEYYTYTEDNEKIAVSAEDVNISAGQLLTVSGVEGNYVMVKTEVSDEDKLNMIKRKSKEQNLKKLPPKKVKTESEYVKLVSRDGDQYTCLVCSPSDDTITSDVTGPSPTVTITASSCCGHVADGKEIMSHMRSEHELRVYICDVCGDDFRKRTELSAHMDEHVANEEGDFQCEICNRIFNNLRLFRIHKRMHQPQQKAWACDRCGKKYSSKNLLDEHINMHIGVRPYVCKACGKDFASKYTFKSHEKTHAVRPRPFQCRHCHKAFLSQQNLIQHERTHADAKDFKCHLCDKQFHSLHNLEVHSIVHTGYKPFNCSLCGKAFARKAEIRDHERIHTGERPYQCEMCGATFSQRSNLQSHKRATHYDDKRYKCDACGKAFKRRRLLDYHIKAAHTGERPFKCQVCDATFVYPEHFKKHRRIHTGEKPYRCEVCGKAFGSRDNRNAHRFVHSDKKPYECLVCGNGFMRKPLLYQHMQSQGHINDTIVVNQPRLTTDDDQIITVNAAGEMIFVEGDVSRLEAIEEDLMSVAAAVEAAGGVTDPMAESSMTRSSSGVEDEDDDEDVDTKLYVTTQDGRQMLVSATAIKKHFEEEDDETEEVDLQDAGNLIFSDVIDASGGEHIIIDGQQLQLQHDDTVEYIDDGTDNLILDDDKDVVDITGEIISASETSIINTKNGPIQLVQVRIPNEKGEEEDAWIKIVDR